MFFLVSDEHCHLITTVRDILLLMFSVLDSGSRGLGSRPAESMCFVLGQDTLLSPCLSPSRSINGYW